MPIGGEKIVNLHAQVAALREDRAKLTRGLAILRRMLRSMRSHDLGGYQSLCDGRWMFASTGLGQVEPETLDELFKLAGIEPDEIESKGDCFHCKHARDDGTDQGWGMPCAGCNGVRHPHFVPASRLVMLARVRRPLDIIRQRNREATLKLLRDPEPAKT
jgi:hypothetical protein